MEAVRLLILRGVGIGGVFISHASAGDMQLRNSEALGLIIIEIEITG